MTSARSTDGTSRRAERIRDAEGALDALREAAGLHGVVLPSLEIETQTLDPATAGAPRLSLGTDDAREPAGRLLAAHAAERQRAREAIS